MKAIIPAAGQGTRLYPQTHTKPKPMVRVAGKPVLGHILENVVRSPIDEAVIVVGVMQEMVRNYAESHYGSLLELSFVEQSRPEGLGHAIYQARSRVAGAPICIVLGDMLFERGYDRFLALHRSIGDVDGSIGIKQVDEPSNYGIVTLSDGRPQALEEKPEDPDSNMAISGIYFIESSERLFDALEYLLDNDIRGAGDEYQLTDALQRMLEGGAEFGTFEVENWYDCGRPKTLLEANRVLLEQVRSSNGEARIYNTSSIVLPPADIGSDVTIEESVVGPYVSIDCETEIVESHVTNAIVGQNSRLQQANLSNSLIGDNASVAGKPNELNVGDSSDIRL